MNCKSSLPAAVACAIGIIGAILRLAHTRTCYEESGLILRHQPLTWLLSATILALILLAVIVGAVIGIHAGKALSNDPPSKTVSIPALLLVSGVLTAVGAVWNSLTVTPLTPLPAVSSVLGLIAAACSVRLAVRPSGHPILTWSCAAVGVFFCLELVRHFAANTLNPVTLSFGPECLAIGAVSLFAFCLGNTRGQVRGFGTVCFGLCAAGLCLTALTGPQITWPDRFFLLAGTLFSLSFLTRLSLSKKVEDLSSDG